MAVAAETSQQTPPIENTKQLFEVWEQEFQPAVIAVAEMEAEAGILHESTHFIGSVALGNEVQLGLVEEVPPPKFNSLMGAIKEAAKGNETARGLITTNARSDVVERTIKAGHVIEVELEVDEQHNVSQYGQTMESIHANTLRYASDNPKMLPRSQAETRNAFRIKKHNQLNNLDDYNLVVFSLAADDMSKKEMADVGFFVETMSCAIQSTSATEDGLNTESAFVAGITNYGEARHDKQTIEKVGKVLGVDYTNKTAVKILDTPILVHKDLMPNGVVDLVKIWDDCVESDKEVFFGQEKPVEDYVEFVAKCKDREAGFADKVELIVDDLIKEAPAISDPITATKRLHKISEKHMVVHAVEDKTIDPRVFGPAAVNIEAARLYEEQGNLVDAQLETVKAIDNAVSSSCPNGSTKTSKGENSSDSDEDCEFISKECPVCHEKNVKTKVSKISATKKRISGSCGCSKVA